MSFFIALENNINVIVLAFNNKTFLSSWVYEKSSTKASTVLPSFFTTKMIVYSFKFYTFSLEPCLDMQYEDLALFDMCDKVNFLVFGKRKGC